MIFKVDKAYDVKRDHVIYTEETPFHYSLEHAVHSNKEVFSTSHSIHNMERAQTFCGEDLVRVRSLYNKRLSFWFYSKTNYVQSFTSKFGLVNDKDELIAGVLIPRCKGVLVDIDSSPITLDDNGTHITGFRHDVTIEVEVEKPVLYTDVPIRGFYFKHPNTGKPVRVQFSSEPESFLTNKSQYPYAVHVGNGFGYYSESRPDLNTQDAVYLTKEGDIALTDKDIDFVRCYNKLIADWRCLGLPVEIGTIRYK